MKRYLITAGLAGLLLQTACPGGGDAPRLPEASAIDGLADAPATDGNTAPADGQDGPSEGDGATPADAPVVYPDGCVPSCKNRQCGGDGCGGSCGVCQPFEHCQTKTGVCGPCPARTRASTAAPPKGASWRFGGGHGYPDTVDPAAPCTVQVSSTAALEQALKAAKSGMTVYVKDGASLDLTGKSLCVPAGVWLAGGRGRGSLPGAILGTTKTTKTPILKACGKGARITGLRIWGADLTTCPPSYATKTCSGTYNSAHCRDCEPASYGVVVSAAGAQLEIDNCELAGWSFAATSFSTGADNKAHHNHMHHTQRMGLGYGVVLGGTASTVSVLIEGNRFERYRHAVAASGSAGQEYEARHNLSGPQTIGHVYDMHGLDEHLHNGTSVAGKRILIHDNSIFASSHYSFVLRGKPVVGAWFYANCTARSASSATLQQYFFGNFKTDVTPTGAAAPNQYSKSPGPVRDRALVLRPARPGPLAPRPGQLPEPERRRAGRLQRRRQDRRLPQLRRRVDLVVGGQRRLAEAEHLLLSPDQPALRRLRRRRQDRRLLRLRRGLALLQGRRLGLDDPAFGPRDRDPARLRRLQRRRQDRRAQDRGRASGTGRRGPAPPGPSATPRGPPWPAWPSATSTATARPTSSAPRAAPGTAPRRPAGPGSSCPARPIR